MQSAIDAGLGLEHRIGGPPPVRTRDGGRGTALKRRVREADDMDMTEAVLVFGSSLVGVGLIVLSARIAMKSKRERRSWGDPRKGNW